jgi:putative transposase
MPQSSVSHDYWHHAPIHIFKPNLAYIVTAGALHKKHYFKDNDRLALLQSTIFEQADKFGWELHAWAVFSNHYHFVANALLDEKNLKRMLQAVHSITAIAVNKMDDAPGRQVWHDYWATALANEESYFARLNYAMRNPEKHGVAADALEYPFCSFQRFCSNARKATQRMVLSFPCDNISICDDF